MSGGFVRRYTSDPGLAELTAIEGSVIIDNSPPTQTVGVGTGVGLLVGEFEDGPVNVATEVTSASVLASTFGGFGFKVNGILGCNPCARSRQADSAIVPEYWNGNGAVALRGKRFRRLVVVRADTSTGSVQFSRLASLSGRPSSTWNLEPGQTISAKIDGAGSATTATFSATAGTVTSSGETFGSIANGDTVTLGFDASPNFTVTFQTGDTTVANIVARINAFAGFALASVSTSHLKLTGRQRGTGGQVRVVSGSSGVLSNLGLSAATTSGTGNVANIDAVTFAELKSVFEGAVSGSAASQLPDGTPRLASTTGLTGTIEITAATATDFGFPIASATAATGSAGTIPAGTIVGTSGGVQFVTYQSVAVTAANAGPYSVKVRPLNDDGTGSGASVGAVTVMDASTLPTFDAFAVSNVAAVSAALSESAIDAAYLAAFDATLNVNTPARVANLSWSARQSNAVRVKGRQNALDASAGGCRGRMFCMRPPLGTTLVAGTGSGTAGVGAYRNERVMFNFPGVTTTIAEIAARGTAGGVGFTATGTIDVGSDGFAASVCSQLNPEENPGQVTDFMAAATGMESAYASVTMGIDEYELLKAAGVMAPRFSDGTAFFQSGVTSDLTYTAVSRRRMADFLEDSIAEADLVYSKKLMTVKRRLANIGETEAFLGSLLSKNDLNQQRIADYRVRDASSAEEIKANVFRKRWAVQLLGSMDVIVDDAIVGTTVNVDDV